MSAPKVTAGIRYSPLVALLAVLLFAFTEDVFTSAFLEILAVGSIVCAASFGVGALVGFLFGIPRRLQRESADAGTGGLVVNTNLEQISDWLTKIIVGVGLVELGAIAGGLNSLADGVALGDGAGADSFALGLLVFSLVDGFLVAYMWTRIELSSQLALADRLLEPLPPPPQLPIPPPPGP